MIDRRRLHSVARGRLGADWAASTRQHAEEEERTATAAALEAAEGQAEQAAAAELAARDALELERVAREEAEKARSVATMPPECWNEWGGEWWKDGRSNRLGVGGHRAAPF